MRDLMFALEAHGSKCYHFGFGSTVIHINLGKGNHNRNCKIFEQTLAIIPLSKTCLWILIGIR